MNQRWLCVACSVVLFSATSLLSFSGGGVYQRTKDGRTYVWNNDPRPGEEAAWSGDHDPNGYGTGHGTLTWYNRGVLLSRYSGKMIRGQFDGPVTKVDAKGRTSRGTYVNGTKSSDWVPVDSNETERETGTRDQDAASPFKSPSMTTTMSEVPGRAPPFASSPTPLSRPAPTQAPSPSVASPPPPITPPRSDPAVRARMIADFKDETRALLVDVAARASGFKQITSFDQLAAIPVPASDRISRMSDRARDFRSNLGYEDALRECGTETVTIDALVAFDHAVRAIKLGDAPSAAFAVISFLNEHSQPPGDEQKPLWTTIESVRVLCDKSSREAAMHLERAESLSNTGKTAAAIQEYESAHAIFPDPKAVRSIKRLREASLGL